jgi:hypothetical protein
MASLGSIRRVKNHEDPQGKINCALAVAEEQIEYVLHLIDLSEQKTVILSDKGLRAPISGKSKASGERE